MKKFSIKNKEVVFDDFLKVEKLELDREGKQITRFVVRRPDSAAVLLYHGDNDSFIFVSQLRAPLVPNNEDPYLLEIVAGGIDEGENPAHAAARETLEETGYRIENPVLISDFYASPGFLGEKMVVFYSEINNEKKVSEGGGREDESEDITIVELPRKKVLQMVEDNEFRDAKTLLALNWWFRKFHKD